MFALAAMLAVAGCEKRGDCDKVVAKIGALIQASGAAAPGATAKAEQETQDLLQRCRERPITKKQEQCVLAQTSLSGVLRCDKQ